MSAKAMNNGLISSVVSKLCAPESYQGVYHHPSMEAPMPSVDRLEEIVEDLRAILFPGFFGDSEITPGNMEFAIGAKLEKTLRLLTRQINRGFCFFCTKDSAGECRECSDKSKRLAREFIETLPAIRASLATDVQAAYVGDPAAKNPGETIFCYPSIKAVANYRIANALHRLGVQLIPRIITEMAHSQTGIDIHPGATIGDYFFIDHGTGTVIGETCIIGTNVRLYQSVTLGAKSFPKDEEGQVIKGIARHPIVEDDVIIYSGATILGRVTIGRGAVIGGNVWVVDDVPSGTKMFRKG